MTSDGPWQLRDLPWCRILTAAVFAAVLAAVLLTFRDYGISWDEEVQNTYGRKLLSLYSSGFRDRSAFSYLNLYYYGGCFDLIAAIVNLHSPFLTYQTRHLLGGLFMLAGLAGCWRLARLLAGERAGLFAVVVLALDPLLYGHSFINPKDAPLAWLSVWVIYYACRALDEPKPACGTVAGFGVALGLALGTRVFAVDLIAYIAATLVLCALAHRFLPAAKAPAAKPAAIALAAGLPVAYVVMAAVWPWAVVDPFNPLTALGEFTNFPWKGLLLFRGHLIPATDLPRSYLLLLLLYQLPEHTLAGLAMAVIAGGLALARRGIMPVMGGRGLQYLLLLQSVLVPLAAFVILRPTIYNGMRHFLFVVPPLGILAGIGWDYTFRRAHSASFAIPAGAALGVALAWELAVMIDLHPYEYLAYNRLVGGVAGANGRFELDYWNTSLAEAARDLVAYLARTHQPQPVAVFICGNRLSAAAALPKDTKLTYDIAQADYFISAVPSTCRWAVDVTKNRIIEVKRDGATLGYVIDLKAARAMPQ